MQGRFWQMHDLLLAHQNQLSFEDLVGFAVQAGLDGECDRGTRWCMLVALTDPSGARARMQRPSTARGEMEARSDKGECMAVTVEQAKLRRANRLLGLGLALIAVGALIATSPSARLVAWLPLLAGVVLVIIGWQLRASAADEQPLRLPPGWYDDPETPERLRYFDGSTWTDRTAGKDRG